MKKNAKVIKYKYFEDVIQFVKLSEHVEQTGNTTGRHHRKCLSRFPADFDSQHYSSRPVQSQSFNEARGKTPTPGLLKRMEVPLLQFWFGGIDFPRSVGYLCPCLNHQK